MEIIEENSKILREFINSNGNSKTHWKLLLTELISNNSMTNIQIIFEINIALKQNINVDLILDIIDFCLEYGSADFINAFQINLDDIYYLNTNKGIQIDKQTKRKQLFLIKKWFEKYGNTYPKFKEIYNKRKEKEIEFPKDDLSKDTYLKFIELKEISDEKYIFEHQNKILKQDLKKTVFLDDNAYVNNYVKESIIKASMINKQNCNRENNQIKPGIIFDNKMIGEQKNNILPNDELIEKNIEIEKIKCNIQDKNINNNSINIDKNIKKDEGAVPTPGELYNLDPNEKKGDLKNIDNNGSMLLSHLDNKSNFYLLGKSNINNFANCSNISNMNIISDRKDEGSKLKPNILFKNQEEYDHDNSKNINKKPEEKEINSNIFLRGKNKNNNFNNNNNKVKYPSYKNIFNENKNNILNYNYQNQQTKPQQINNNNSRNSKGNDFASKNNYCNNNINNLYNNNYYSNYNKGMMNNHNNIKYNDNNYSNAFKDEFDFTLGSKNNKNDIGFINQVRKANSSYKDKEKKIKNNTYLNTINFENYKIKIENKIKQLNSWMDKGYISFYNTYNGSLNKGIEEIKKEISMCDKLINNYKNNIVNMERVRIIENLKELIAKLLKRYDKFMKDNLDLNIISKSALNNNYDNFNLERERNSAL